MQDELRKEIAELERKLKEAMKAIVDRYEEELKMMKTRNLVLAEEIVKLREESARKSDRIVTLEELAYRSH